MRVPILLILALLSFGIPFVYSGRILVTYALGSASHLRSMMPLIDKLIKAGHKITLFEVQQTHQGQIALDPSITRMTVGLTVRNSTKAKISDMLWNRDYLGVFISITEYFSLMANEQIFRNHVKELWTIMHRDFDLVMADELFNDYGFVFAEHFFKSRGVPYVIFGPTITTINDEYYLGSGRNWANTPPFAPATPLFFDEKYVFSSFFTRVHGFVDSFFELIPMFMYDWQLRYVVGERVGVRNFNNFEFIPNSHLFLTDDLYNIGFTTSRVHNLLPIGAYCSKTTGSLDDDFKNFVEDKKSKGTIYVSFGTYVDWKIASAKALPTLLGTFEAMSDYRFIFTAYNGPKVNASSNVRIMKWAPQAEILAHPKTKVFFTHGGIKSVRESICAGVPMLVMPLTYDEVRLSHVVAYRGMGGTHNKHWLNTHGVVNDLTRLLKDNRQYKQRIRRIRDAFVDRPIPDVDVGAFYVSRLVRLFEKRNERPYNGTVRLFRDNRSTKLAFYDFTYMTHAFFIGIIWYSLLL